VEDGELPEGEMKAVIGAEARRERGKKGERAVVNEVS
jgi:hypothetical protein